MTSTMSFPKLEYDTIFQKNWQTYQVVLRENYIQHRKLYEKVPEYLQHRFLGAFSILDLGCGDVDYLSKILQKHNIWSRVSTYIGVDLSEQAMQVGEQNVRSMLATDAHLSFVVDDMLNFVKKAATASYDLVFTSISVHHLQDSDKEQLVHEVRRILRPNGAFILIDIFLQEDEDRDNFVQEFAVHVRGDWVKLNSEQTESLVNHALNFDFPAKLTIWEREEELRHQGETRRAQANESRELLSIITAEEAAYQRQHYENDIHRILHRITSASPHFIAQFRLADRHMVTDSLLDTICTICLDNFRLNQHFAQWPCTAKHTFHFDCMLDVLREGSTYPLCRYPVETAGLPSIEAAFRLLVRRMINDILP